MTPRGNLYIADTQNKRIRMVSGGIITTIAGNGSPSVSGDGGPALSAAIGLPAGIAVDHAGNVFFSDGANNRIRELTPSGSPACTFSVSPTILMPGTEGGNLNVSVQTGAGCAWALQGLPGWISYSGNAVMTGPSTVTLAVASNAGEGRTVEFTIAGVSMTVSQAVNPTLPPLISGVFPIYGTFNFSPQYVQAGEWISIFGNNFALTDFLWKGDFPESLGGVTVTIDGKPGYLSYVGPTQINVQAPDDPTMSGTVVNLTVTTANGSATASVELAPFSPSLNLFDSTHAAGVIPTPDGSGAYGNGTYDLLGPVGAFSFATRPAKPGETIELYGVGFGPTNPAVPAGAPFTGSAPMVNTPTITIGNVPAPVSYAGITGAGLYQFNIVVPNITGQSGDYPVQINVTTPTSLDPLNEATATVSLALPAQ